MPRSLAIAFGLATVTACAGSAAAQVECGPAVELSQPAPELEAALARRGVRGASAGCPGLAVRIEPTEGGLSVAREKTAPDTVPDVETAALLIETWVRADLIDPLLAARRGPPPPSPRPLSVDVGVDGAWTTDRGSWIGGRVEGCITLDWLCAGVRLRGLYDPGLTGESAAGRVWRVGLGAMATGELVFGATRAGVGLGVDVVRVDGRAGVEDSAGAPLFEVRAGHAFAIDERWSIEASLAADLALWPRRVQNELDAQALPGLPLLMVLGGVGARWTAP